jgi:outer membrane protein OmpA-like peptidoglycan-associated protein
MNCVRLVSMRYERLFAAALAVVLLDGGTAFAQRRDGHPGGYRGHFEAYRPYYGPRYYPYPFYVSPFYAAPYIAPGYPAPLYAPPPYVERYYVEGPSPAPVQRRYGEFGERSYAQIVPRDTPQPTAPRMERLTLSARELFGFDQDQLRLPQPKLDEIAAALKREPRIEAVRITGYTDRIGSDAYNMKLSQRRAAAVKRYLVSRGVAPSRLVAAGKGKADPVVQCNDKKMADLIKCLEPNRRVEVEQITIERRLP